MADFVKLGDKKYALDITKICQYLNSTSDKEAKETEILDTYDFNDGASPGSLAAKSIREMKSSILVGHDGFAYDLIKICVVQLLAYDDMQYTTIEDMPFGQKLAFNTLLLKGFLIEINGK